MRPVKAADANVELVLHPDHPDRNLPAQKLRSYDPDLGETPDQARTLWRTTWAPSEGEARALANGAHVALWVWGEGHPPVKVDVGEPPLDAVAFVARPIADRAAGVLCAVLGKRLAGGAFPGPEEILDLWTRALQAAEEGDDEVLDMIEEADKAVGGSSSELVIPGQTSIEEQLANPGVEDLELPDEARIAQDERDVGPDLGGSPMELDS